MLVHVLARAWRPAMGGGDGWEAWSGQQSVGACASVVWPVLLLLPLLLLLRAAAGPQDPSAGQFVIQLPENTPEFVKKLAPGRAGHWGEAVRRRRCVLSPFFSPLLLRCLPLR